MTVQFCSVAEKFTPHDTIFEFSQSSELQESNISSACSLHTSPSIKSKDGSPRRGLAGISENEMESPTEHAQTVKTPETYQQEQEQATRVSLDDQTRHEKVNEILSAHQAHKRSASGNSQSTFRPRTASDTNKALPAPPREESTLDERLAESISYYGDQVLRPSNDDRYSSQSARPSPRDLHDAYDYKPKTKLGPRPSMDSQRGPDGSTRLNDFRPVASLPAGLRMPPRKANAGRPTSRQGQSTSPEKMSPEQPPPLPTPLSPRNPVQASDRKQSITSNGLPTPLKTPEPKSPKMTPEKMRLMKALQLRQKQLAAKKQVNGLGIEELSEDHEPGDIKAEANKKDSDAMVAVNGLDREPNGLHIRPEDLRDDERHNVEASPISIADTTDGPSTQASSITEEEDTPTKKKQSQDFDHDSTHAARKDMPQPHASESEPPLGSIQSSDDSNKHQGDNQNVTLSLTEESGFVDLGSTASSINGQESRSLQFGESEAQSLACKNTSELQDRSSLVEPNETPLKTDAGATSIENPPAMASEPSAEQNSFNAAVYRNSHDAAALPGTQPPSADIPSDQIPQEHLKKGAQVPSVADSSAVLPTDTEADDVAVNKNSVHEALALSKSSTEVQSCAAIQAPEAVNDTSAPPLSTPTGPKDRSPGRSKEPASEVAFSNVIPKHTGTDKKSDEPTASAVATVSPVAEVAEEHDNGLHASPNDIRRLSEPMEIAAEEGPSLGIKEGPKTGRLVKRHGVVSPSNKSPNIDQSDEHFLSDDSFMDELKSATVQEAKPVSVSKSPIKPVFSRSQSEQRLVDIRASRSVSSPIQLPLQDEEAGSLSHIQRAPAFASRSFSASHTPRSESQSPPLPKSTKVGVSSGISQRIRALEQLHQSSRPTSPQPLASTPTPSAFANLRKTSHKGAPPSHLNQNQAALGRPSSAYPSPSPSPEITNGVKWNPFNQPKRPTTSPRPDSVSVTATIVRDSNNKTPERPLNPSEPRAMDLHQSPLVVEHQKLESKPQPPLSPLKPPRPRYARYSSARSGSSSSTDQGPKSERPSTSRRESFASIRSRSSRAPSEADLPRSISDSSLGSAGSPDGSKEDKKDSKGRRLLKRMSSISSMSRRSIAHALSPGPKEGPIFESQEPIAETPVVSGSVDIGDVNVQFPDTLVGLFPDAVAVRLTDIIALEAEIHDHRRARHYHSRSLKIRQCPLFRSHSLGLR